MQLLFNVKEQTLTLESVEKNVVANSLKYLTCKFSFSEDWDGLTKTAIFISAKGDVYNQILNDDACVVPWEVIEHPYFIVSVFGGDRITANKVTVEVTKSGYMKGKTPQAPTPDVYQQILKKIEDIEVGGVSDDRIIAIVNEEIKKLNVPKKISDLFDDTDHNPIFYAQLAERANTAINADKAMDAEYAITAEYDTIGRVIFQTYATRDELIIVEKIAKGRATGYVFDTVDDMNLWIADEKNKAQLVLGDNLYIRAINVPDFWWDGENPQILETQKVDMSEYATKKELQSAIGEALESDY